MFFKYFTTRNYVSSGGLNGTPFFNSQESCLFRLYPISISNRFGVLISQHRNHSHKHNLRLSAMETVIVRDFDGNTLFSTC